MQQKRQYQFFSKKEDQLAGQYTPTGMALKSLTANTEGYSAIMDAKHRSQNPKRPLQPILILLSYIGIIVVFLYALSISGSISDKVNAGLGNKLEKPLQTLAVVEERTNKIANLETTQSNIQQKLMELDLKFDLYFGQQPVNKKTTENIVGRAVDRIKDTQDPVQQTIALQVTSNVLGKASANHVTLDYKKINRYGLALLDQSYSYDQQSVLKNALSELARQRVMRSQASKVREDKSQESKKILDCSTMPNKEKELDVARIEEGTTFTNCKIIYRGGWIGLINVRFIDCTFDVIPAASGKEIYEDLFNSDEPIPFVTVKTDAPFPVSPNADKK